MISFRTKYLALLSCVEMLIKEMGKMHEPTKEDIEWTIDYLKYISTMSDRLGV